MLIKKSNYQTQKKKTEFTKFIQMQTFIKRYHFIAKNRKNCIQYKKS